jgi:hypothetical protein
LCVAIVKAIRDYGRYPLSLDQKLHKRVFLASIKGPTN